MEKINLKLTVTNCFLIKNKEKYILIDTGYEYEWELFCKRLKEVGVSISEISHIILTHHHDDHCGLLNKILEENNAIKVVMSYLAKDLLLKGENDQSHGGGLINKRIKLLLSLGLKRFKIMITLKKFINKKSNLKFTPYKIRENDILITKESTFKEIGIDLNGTIIETPGHSIDSISLLFDDGDCIVGDAAANFMQFAGTKYCVIYVCDIDEYYNSWTKIISRNAKIIFPSHGDSFIVEKLKDNIGKNKKENMVMNK
ncbi:MBL fold metallo-hydrolase [Clostridium uliginosum]|uniref:Glyoxylase, beta-lactamase superfamily II n=1 Tax=Clostridium uliginosum TaxID=119641 RepID=A0A1I1QN52_9CLOT|nr:MBL fold metallo-hydrolase [Clostridium uliginosum]SFD23554.1 Glyoxylase, beta-lactamase superfamily II [Clostridium uliginosum]